MRGNAASSIAIIVAAWFAGVAVWFGFKHKVFWSAFDAGLCIYWLGAAVQEVVDSLTVKTSAFRYGDFTRR